MTTNHPSSGAKGGWPPTSYDQGMSACIFESPFSGNNPGKTEIYRMDSLKSKVSIVVVCALAAAVVLYSSVYLGIDAASLSAQMPSK